MCPVNVVTSLGDSPVTSQIFTVWSPLAEAISEPSVDQAKGHDGHFVSRQRRQQFAGLRVVDTDSALARPGDQAAAVRREGHGADRLVKGDSVDFFAGGGIPECGQSRRRLRSR